LAGVSATYDDDLLYYDTLYDTLYDLQVFMARTNSMPHSCYDFRDSARARASELLMNDENSARLNEKEEDDDTEAVKLT